MCLLQTSLWEWQIYLQFPLFMVVCMWGSLSKNGQLLFLGYVQQILIGTNANVMEQSVIHFKATVTERTVIFVKANVTEWSVISASVFTTDQYSYEFYVRESTQISRFCDTMVSASPRPF